MRDLLAQLFVAIDNERVYIGHVRVSIGYNSYMRKNDREKFVRLATKRVSAALKAIQLIGNLSNKSNYDYTEEDVQKIIRALQEELGACRKKFELARKRQSETQFKLE